MRRNEIHPPTDFVITWVDGSDKVWQRMRGKYASSMTNDDRRKNSKARYRDMELLRFWFRGVEQFAPWVNRIHFVTCGQVPPWLNTKHPKLHVVNHTDYIPPKNLPTFNSNAIELGIHQIAGLTEQFVYFNDDVFLTAPIEEMTFFRNGLPCDMYEVKALVSFADGDDIDYTRLNNLGVINRHFFGRRSKLCAARKKYNIHYPAKVNLRNLYSVGWKGYIGIADPHIAIPYLKSDFQVVWNAESSILQNTCSHKFRSPYDINHWIFRYWRLITGEFNPVNLYAYTKCFQLRDEDMSPIMAIRDQKYKIICLNDNLKIKNFETVKKSLQKAFFEVLPNISQFESFDLEGV